MSQPGSDAEASICAALEARDQSTAATVALEAYGREILSFLVLRLRALPDAEEVFSIFVEDFWKSLPEFARRCSMRVWMYTLARNAANRYLRSAQRKHRQHWTPLARDSLLALAERARSETQVHLRTDVKDKLRAFREQLEPDDQLLLVLHVDRALPWREVAMVLHENGEQLSAQALEREVLRLRKRFERVKIALRQHAEREGLGKT
jgi:RNA polymerase sigma factor (sigma-70 family)